MWTKEYRISSQVRDGAVRGAKLQGEIAAVIGTPVSYIETEGDFLRIYLDYQPSAHEETLMGSIVKNHVTTPKTQFIVPSMMIPRTEVVTGGMSPIGGVVTDVSKFVDPVVAIGQIVGEMRSTGTGAVIQVVQNVLPGGDPITIGRYEIPDTGGTWQPLFFQTDTAPETGLSAFTLEGDLGGASLTEIRYVTMSLLEQRN